MCSVWQNHMNIMPNLYLFTNPYEHGDKYEWNYWQIHTEIIANPQEYHDNTEWH